MDQNQIGNRLFGKTCFLVFSVVLLFIFIGDLKVVAETTPEQEVIEEDDFKYMVLINAENAVGVMEYLGKEKKVNIPNKIEGYPYNVVAIGVYNGNEVFRGKGLTSVNFPDSIREINTSVFEDNELTHLQLPSNLKSILHYAFANNKLKEVNFPKNLEIIGVGSFSGNPLTKITIPTGLDFIDDEAFANNTSGSELEVIIHEKDVIFGTDVFTGFKSPDQVIIIGKSGSTAETYANDNGHTFKVLGEDENGEKEEKKENEPKTKDGILQVKPGESVDISFSGEHMATLKIPKTLKGAIDTLEVKIVKNKDAPKGHDVGGVILDFVFKDEKGNVIEVEGEFELYLKVKEGTVNPTVFHLLDDEKWVEVGGEFSDEFISVTVNHFSTYGVFTKNVMEKENEIKTTISIEDEYSGEVSEDGEGQTLPKTATPHFTILLAGLSLMTLGFLLFLFNRKRIN